MAAQKHSSNDRSAVDSLLSRHKVRNSLERSALHSISSAHSHRVLQLHCCSIVMTGRSRFCTLNRRFANCDSTTTVLQQYCTDSPGRSNSLDLDRFPGQTRNLGTPKKKTLHKPIQELQNYTGLQNPSNHAPDYTTNDRHSPTPNDQI